MKKKVKKILKRSKKVEDYRNEILKAKNDYIRKMTEWFKGGSKAYWNILKQLLYNENVLTIPSLLGDGQFISSF